MKNKEKKYILTPLGYLHLTLGKIMGQEVFNGLRTYARSQAKGKKTIPCIVFKSKGGHFTKVKKKK